MKMADRTLKLDTLLPPTYIYPFIDEPGVLRIYAQYKSTDNTSGQLALGIDSAAALDKRWKAALSNMRIVVDLGPFPDVDVGGRQLQRVERYQHQVRQAAPAVRPRPRSGRRDPADPGDAVGRRLRSRDERRHEQLGRQLGIQVRLLEGDSGHQVSVASAAHPQPEPAAEARGRPEGRLLLQRGALDPDRPQAARARVRRLRRVLRPPAGAVLHAGGGERVRRRAGHAGDRRRQQGRHHAAHEVRLRRGGRGRPPGRRERRRPLHGGGRGHHRRQRCSTSPASSCSAAPPRSAAG